MVINPGGQVNRGYFDCRGGEQGQVCQKIMGDGGLTAEGQPPDRLTVLIESLLGNIHGGQVPLRADAKRSVWTHHPEMISVLADRMRAVQPEFNRLLAEAFNAVANQERPWIRGFNAPDGLFEIIRPGGRAIHRGLECLGIASALGNDGIREGLKLLSKHSIRPDGNQHIMEMGTFHQARCGMAIMGDSAIHGQNVASGFEHETAPILVGMRGVDFAAYQQELHLAEL